MPNADAYRRKLRTGTLRLGNRGPLQRLARAVLARRARALGWDRALARKS